MIAALAVLLLASTGLRDVETAHRKVVSSDGAALALYRYRPADGADGRRPVLLVPDLGMRKAVFDLQGDGLARWLAGKGRLVYVAELRGQGAAVRNVWHLSQYVERDLPAIAKAIGEPFDLIAHGWSGTLALAAASHELKGKVVRVVAFSTPVEADVPNRLTEQLLEAGGRLSELADDPPAFSTLFAHRARFSEHKLSALRQSALCDLSREAASELLGWMRSGDLNLSDGSTVKSRLARYDVPTLLLLPLADNWAGSELAAPLREVSKAPVVMKAFSRFELVGEDYTHLSLLHGDRAKKDVFPALWAFLTAEPR